MKLFKLGKLPSALDFINWNLSFSILSWGAAVAAIANLVTANEQNKAQKYAAGEARMSQEQQAARARADLAPYREFGARQVGELQNWLGRPEGQFRAPTMEEVQAGQGYKSRLGAVEGSAAARGSLFSGNALRDIGEFGASEYGQEYGRKQTEYQNELAKRMSLANIGYGAAGGSAGIAQNLGQSLANIQTGQGAATSRAIGSAGSGVSGAIGQYQGQQNWNAFLNRIGSEKKSGGGWSGEDDYGSWGEDETDSGDYGW